MYPSIHRVIPEKEKRSAIKFWIFIVIYSGVFLLICYLVRELMPMNYLDGSDYVTLYTVIVLASIYFSYTNYKSKVGKYCLELMSESEFKITTRKGTDVLKEHEIINIEMGEHYVFKILVKGKPKSPYISSNLEDYEKVLAYFHAMAIRIKNRKV
jgi:hypothetical protein